MLKSLKSVYPALKESSLSGRYITNSSIEKCLPKHTIFDKSIIGRSVENRPIYSLKFGTGQIKILIWSQMHGNESTSTKALFDCFNYLKSDIKETKQLLGNCTFLVIPILNPDGAEAYKRFNANKVDLNRDAQKLSQPESRLLRKVYEDFRPDYCFNLHGQRTIFGSGDTGIAATLSFLSPSQDQSRSLTTNRKRAMAVISKINNVLQNEIPNGIGRYDDGFNLNCVGDTFQSLGTPTVLFESGHYPNDYDREEVRYFTFLALVTAFNEVSNGINDDNFEGYFEISENTKTFYDVIIRNATVNSSDQLQDIAFQFIETLKDDRILFIPRIEKISKLNGYFGHREIDADGGEVFITRNEPLKVGIENDFVLLNNDKIILNNQ